MLKTVRPSHLAPRRPKSTKTHPQARAWKSSDLLELYRLVQAIVEASRRRVRLRGPVRVSFEGKAYIANSEPLDRLTVEDAKTGEVVGVFHSSGFIATQGAVYDRP